MYCVIWSCNLSQPIHFKAKTGYRGEKDRENIRAQIG